MDLALYHPAIPQNTGNIGRLCVGLGASLHLIGPIGFDIDDKSCRRAGLDYWPHLTWKLHQDDDAFLEWLGDRQPWLITKFAERRIDQVPWNEDDIFILGNENKGLPQPWHQRWADRLAGIPITGQVRSFNLANAAAMTLYQAKLAAGGFA